MSQYQEAIYRDQLRSRSRLFIVIAVSILPIEELLAANYREVEEIAPTSAQESLLGLGRADAESKIHSSRRIFQKYLDEAGPFWRDSSVPLKVRGYDFRQESGLDVLADASAIGTELGFESGKWHDRISVVTSWHTSSAIDAPPDLGGSGLLQPDQSNLSVVSRAYFRIDLTEDTYLQLGRQDFNLPYLNRADSRMVPNTHAAYGIGRSRGRTDFLLGYVTKMKRRDSEDFIPMGQIAGVPGNESGTTIGGVRFDVNDELTIGAMALHTRDLYGTLYGETSFNHTFNDKWGLQVAAQLTHQWSVGDELLGDFDSRSHGMRAAISYQGAVLTYARTKNSGEHKVRSPFGGRPSFTTGMLYNFDRPGGRAWRIGLSQNFEAYGLPGASVAVSYLEGSNGNAIFAAVPDNESEFSAIVDYRPPRDALRGLWLRVRYAEGRRGDPMEDRRSLRIIVNYDLRAL